MSMGETDLHCREQRRHNANANAARHGTARHMYTVPNSRYSCQQMMSTHAPSMAWALRGIFQQHATFIGSAEACSTACHPYAGEYLHGRVRASARIR